MADEYQVIYDYQSLVEMKNDVNGTYHLGCNIDCSASVDNPWTSFDFYGDLIGSGYAICNLHMEQGGFFGTLTGNLSGVGFINCVVHKATQTGIVAKQIRCKNKVVERCYVEGCLVEPPKGDTWYRSNQLGGFCYRIGSGTVKECYVANTVIGQEDSTKQQCETYAGGFAASIGSDESGAGISAAGVFDCYTQNCTIYVVNYGGGFCGVNSYGFNYDPRIVGIKRCYASSRVILRANDRVGVKGGFIAQADQKALEYQQGNFYNLDVFGINNGQGYGYAKMTEQMKDIETFKDKNWEFSIVNDDGTVTKKTWRIEDGLTYPYLQYNKQFKDIIPMSFLKVKNSSNMDLYAPLVDYNDINLKGIPHLFIRV